MDDLDAREWSLLDGVVETATAYRFDPLGVVVQKGTNDTVSRLVACGLVSQRRPWWSPVRFRSRLLPLGCLRAALHVIRHYGGALLVVAIPAFLIAVTGLATGARGTLAVGVLALLVVLSLLVHEGGHAVVFRAVDRRSAAILTTRGADAALRRPTMTARREVAVICAGPCAPLVCGAPVLLGWQAWWPLALAWLAVSAAHLAALVVPCGDGANLRRFLRGVSGKRGAGLSRSEPAGTLVRPRQPPSSR